MRRLEDIQKKRYFFHDIKDSELKEDWERLIEQAERVEELEEFNRILSSDKSMFIEELVREQHQNKRYREAFNSIMTLWKYSEDRTDFEWLAHKMSEEARKALEESD